MTSLADLFNPSFFIILGIVVLLSALIAIYFETKMREQNHKIASMFSLVSTLAEDMGGVKMGLNHLAVTFSNGGSQSGISQNIPFPPQNLGTNSSKQNNLKLIDVSDDDSENDDETDNDDETEKNVIMNNYELEDDETSSEGSVEENIKVVKLSIAKDEIEDDAEDDTEDDTEDEYNLNFETDGDLVVVDDTNEIPEISEGYVEKMLSLKYDDKVGDDKVGKEELVQPEEYHLVASSSELKTISINLGNEPVSGNIDYQKLKLPQLRQIALEKDLTVLQFQKLNKRDLIKLLEEN